MNKPKIQIIPLGGVDEVGKNMYVIGVDDNYFILDAGIKFQEMSYLGVDLILPNFQFISDHLNSIRGVFVTHSDPNYYGALAYLLKQFPSLIVYASDYTAFCIRRYCAKLKINDFNLIVCKHFERLIFGNINVTTFDLFAANPGTFGVVIETKAGNIVYMNDFILAQPPKNFSQFRFRDLTRISTYPILALLVGVQNINHQLLVSPTHNPYRQILTLCENIQQQRIIISVLDTDFFSIYQILLAAKTTNRHVYIVNLHIINMMKTLSTMNYWKLDNLQIKPLSEYEQDQQNSIVIIAENIQNIYYSLINFANDKIPQLLPHPADVVILKLPLVAGFEMLQFQTIDELVRRDLIIHNLHSKIISPMSAGAEDLKILLSLCRPTYFFPINALYKEMLTAKQYAAEMELRHDKVILAQLGDCYETNDRNEFIKVDTNIETKGVLQHQGVEVNTQILDERLTLSNQGVFTMIIKINPSDQIQPTMTFKTAGLVISDQANLTRQLKEIINKNYLEFNAQSKRLKTQQWEAAFYQCVQNFLRQKLFLDPVIIISVYQ